MRRVIRWLGPVYVASFLAGCSQERALPTSFTEPLPVSPAPVLATSGETTQPLQAHDRLKVDQSNLVSEQLGLGNGLYGQTYVPKAKDLARVDLLFIVNQVPAGGAVVTVGLYDDITQPPIATSAAAFVAPPVPGELRRTVSLEFDPPVPLSKRTTYVIGASVPSTMSWEFAFGDAYPDGQIVLFDGTPLNPPGDFVFTTYELK